MTYRTPILQVTGPDGIDCLEKWGSRLVGVRIVTRMTDEHDECTFTFLNEPPYLEDPGLNAPFTVKVGWSLTSMTLGGIYYYARTEYDGSPEEGDKFKYICRSGLTADLEQASSQHFNAENGNKTLGDVFRNLFAGRGVDVQVSDRIAGLPLPGGHLLQWNQSNIDFGTDLANQVGAVLKPMGGKILVLDRSSGESVTGQNLAPLFIAKVPNYRYSAEMEPRFLYKEVSSTYTDNATGKLGTETTTATASSGAADGLHHPAPDQAAAKVFAQARADQYKRYSGTALFEMPGEPNAVQGCRVTATGYPPAICAVQWIATEVTHDVEPNAGWMTTVETETDTD